MRGTEHGETDSDGDKREEREGRIRNGNPVSPSGARTAGGRRGTGSQAVLGSCRVGGRVELVMWQLRKGTAAPQLWMAIAHHFALRLMPHALCCRAHQLQFRSAALLFTDIILSLFVGS